MLSVVGRDSERPLWGHNVFTQPVSPYALMVDWRLANRAAVGLCDPVNGKICDFYAMLTGQSSRRIGLTGYGLDVKSSMEFD